MLKQLKEIVEALRTALSDLKEHEASRDDKERWIWSGCMRKAGLEVGAYRFALTKIAEGIREDRRKIEAEYYNSSMSKKQQEEGGLPKMAENTEYYMRANEHIRETYYPTNEQLDELLKEQE